MRSLVDRAWSRPAVLAVAALVLAAAAVLARWPAIDLDVYLVGARHLRSGLYAARAPVTGLPFTYPPFAALLFVPLAHLPQRWAQWAWASVNLGAVGALWYVSLLALRPGTPRALAARWSTLLAAPTAYLLEPLRSAIWLGQVDILLVVATVHDLSRPERRTGGRLPQGLVLGIAAAVKLTPLVFVPYLFGVRRGRSAARALAGFVACSAVAAAVAPRASAQYWSRTVFEWTRIGSAAFVSNQSLRGALVRLHHGPVPRAVVVAAALAAGISGLALAVYAGRHSSGFVGMLVAAATGLVASPVSWTHAFAWVVPLLCWLRLGDDRPRHGRAVAVAVAALFAVGVPWLVPWRGTSDLAERPWQLAVGDAYVLAMLGLLAALAALLAGRSRARSRRPGSGRPAQAGAATRAAHPSDAVAARSSSNAART